MTFKFIENFVTEILFKFIILVQRIEWKRFEQNRFAIEFIRL